MLFERERRNKLTWATPSSKIPPNFWDGCGYSYQYRGAQVSIRPAVSKGHNHSVISFRARDGFDCNLVHVESDRTPDRGPILLVHGAGVRSNIFCPPTET